MQTTAAEALKQSDAARDERHLHRRMQWFTEKWTVALDLNKRDAAEFHADLLLLVQAIHTDASRTTHALLAKSLAAMPLSVFVTEKKT